MKLQGQEYKVDWLRLDLEDGEEVDRRKSGEREGQKKARTEGGCPSFRL